MKNILVTGGAGFIGSHTVVELVEAGFRPIIADDFSNAHEGVVERMETLLNQKIVVEKGNCSDGKWLSGVMKKHAIDGVIHFAAFKAVGESVVEPLNYYQNNLSSLLQVLASMEENGVKNLVFSSSCTVYGNPETGVKVSEQTPLGAPSSPYGWSKWMCEQIIRDVSANDPSLNATILRYFNPIGAHESGLIGEYPQVPNNILPFMTEVAKGKRPKLVVFGSDYATPDGTCVRDYIHVVDLAVAHVQSLTYMQQHAGVSYFNIGTGKGTSVLELIAAFEQAIGKPLNWEFGPRRTVDIAEIYADSTKANQELGWEAKRTLQDAVNDAWKWEMNLG